MKNQLICLECRKPFTPPARWNRVGLPDYCLPCWAEKVTKVTHQPYRPTYRGWRA